MGRTFPQIQHMPKIIDFLGYNLTYIDDKSLGGRIKEYRLKQGLSHKVLGRILEVDGSTVCSWEKGKFKPNLKTQNKLEILLCKT